MKKKLLFIPLMLVSVLTSCGLRNDYHFKNTEYPQGGIKNYEYDEDMVIDGIGDETNYVGLEWFTIYEPEYDVTLKTRTYFGKNGFYFYTYVNDTSVFYNKTFDPYANDGVEMHICVNPSETMNPTNLLKGNKVLDSMMQIRSDVGGRLQTWAGNGLSGSYEWTQYYRPCDLGVHVDGRVNRKDAADGYGIEMYVPYCAFGLTEAPEEVSIMPAFNNTDNNVDTTRKWFTYKGMAHNFPSSWMHVTKDGKITYPGKGILPDGELACDKDDERYLYQIGSELYQVDQNNQKPELRATFKSYKDDYGVYVQAVVLDKELTRYNDSIWNNDGIEFVIDTKHNDSDDMAKTGIFRFALDVDNGVQTDSYLTDYYYYDSHGSKIVDSASYRIATISKTSINQVNIASDYGYQYEYVYEMFIPYEAMNIDSDNVGDIYGCFAVKTINESVYIKNRRDGEGHMEPDNWLWVDHHYLKNALEFYQITELGLYE